MKRSRSCGCLLLVCLIAAAGCSALTPRSEGLKDAEPGSIAPTPSETRHSAPSDEWADILKEVRSSVVRLSVVECEGSPIMGSGFIVGPRLVMTASHVVNGSRTISVQSESGELTSAELVGLDESEDAALVRTADDLSGTPATLSRDDPEQGSDLAVLGYPLGVYDLRMVTGIVSGLNESVEYPQFRVDRVFTTDASTNGGNSGGPVYSGSREVIGLVSGGATWDGSDVQTRRPVQGINYIVPSSELADRLDRWHDDDSQQVEECEDDTGPAESGTDLDVTVDSDDPEGAAIAQSLFTHGRSINEGSYASAWTIFTKRMQHDMGDLGKWSSGLQTSHWETLKLSNLQHRGSTVSIDAKLQTRQDSEWGYQGQTCSRFKLTYTMKQVRGMWRIDHAARHGHQQPC